jgi:phosphomannomutase
VVAVTDYSQPTGTLPATDLLAFSLEGGTRVLIRPSGTEPKLKAYIEVVVPVGAAGLTAARDVAEAQLRSFEADVRSRLTTG